MSKNYVRMAMLQALDKYLGLRVWGLIIYGVLPSNLAFLGVIDVQIGDTNPLLLLPAGTPLLALLFMLLKTRLRETYLTLDGLVTRSFVQMILIVVVATLICFASQVPKPIPIQQKWASALLLAIVSLVASSSLFMTAMIKKARLPGLPDPGFVEKINEAKRELILLSRSRVFTGYDPARDQEDVINSIAHARNISDLLNQASSFPGHRLAAAAHAGITANLTQVVEALERVRDGASDALKREHRDIFFGDANPQGGATVRGSGRHELALEERQIRAEVQRFKKLKVGA
jgi:uncharacterized membrane protein